MIQLYIDVYSMGDIGSISPHSTPYGECKCSPSHRCSTAPTGLETNLACAAGGQIRISHLSPEHATVL